MHREDNTYEALEQILSTRQVGDVASDHQAELAGFKGWNWVAITAVAKQATRALTYVYDDSPEDKAVRRQLRNQFGHEWRDRALQKGLVREHQGEVMDSSHPLMKLMRRPNPNQSGGEFRWEQILQLRLHGSCLIFNRPNVLGNRTVERYVIPMAMVTPIRPGRLANMPRGGVTIRPHTWNAYLANMSNSTADSFSSVRQFVNCDLPIELISIVKYPHPFLKGDGASPTHAAAPWIDGGNSLDDVRDEYYREGPNGKVLISSEMDDPKKIREAETKLTRDLSKDGPQVTIIGGGGNSILLKRSADEMQFTEGHDQFRDAVLAAQGVSKAMVGIQDNMTYAGLAAALLGSMAMSVQPDLDLMADQDSVRLGPEYGPNISIELEAPVMNDPELEDRRLERDAKIGVMTIGEYRMKRGEKPFGNELDDYIMTEKGPVHPQVLIEEGRAGLKPRASSPGISAPSEDVEGPRVSSGTDKIGEAFIDADPTMLPSVSNKSLMSLKKVGIQVRPWDDSKGPESAGVWSWNHGPTITGLLEAFQGSRLKDRIDEARRMSETHEFACVMLEIPKEFAASFKDHASFISEGDLAEGGVVTEPHITALYGITGASRETIIRAVTAMEQPLVSFGPTAAFDNGEHGVPLYVAVQGADARQCHEYLSDVLPHVKMWPDYVPHVTLAYVSDAEKYAGKATPMTGKSCYVKRAIISMENGERIVVPLKRQSIIDSNPPVPSQLRAALTATR